MKELKFMTIAPSDNYFSWQIHAWLESLKNIGHSDKAIILIFTPKGRDEHRERFQKIINLYPEAEFNFYKDEHDITPLLGIYIPILRLYTAWRYWQDKPEMKEKAVFYCDSDILFTDKFNIDAYIEDDINYASDTNSYINASYFDSKIRDVLPEKLEEYKKIDVLDEAAKLIGINRQIAEKNNLHSGGTQYLLKNIDAEYWKKLLDDCIPLKRYLEGVNKQYFASESKGFQSWTCDMWLVLWELWRRNQEVKVVKDLDFAWATDSISKIDNIQIFHNAGISSTVMNNIPYFYKGKYHQGQDPFKDTQIDIVLNNEESKKYCTWWYANKLKELHQKYKLDY